MPRASRNNDSALPYWPMHQEFTQVVEARSQVGVAVGEPVEWGEAFRHVQGFAVIQLRLAILAPVIQEAPRLLRLEAKSGWPSGYLSGGYRRRPISRASLKYGSGLA